MSAEQARAAADAARRRCSTSRAHNLARGRGRRARSSSPGRSTGRGDRRPLPDEHARARRAADAAPLRPRRHGASPTPPRADVFAAKGARSRRCSTRCASTGASIAGASEPFLHPGPVGCDPSSATASLGWLGELHPLVAARVGARRAGRRASRSTSARPSRRPRPGAALRGLHVVPGAAPGPRGRRRRRRGRRRGWSRWCARPGGDAARARRGLRRLPRRAGRRGQASRSRCALEFRAADRTLTDEEVAPRARARSSSALRDELGGELRG